MLELSELWAGYDSALVVRGLSLRVAPGQVVALLGRNGVGKSTTVGAAAGLVASSEGHVLLDGVDIRGWAPHRISRAGLAYVPQGRRLFAALTVKENLLLGARDGGAGGWTLERVYALFPNLERRQDIPSQALSGGEQQMAAIGRALLTNPKVLLLDEPSEGLAPLAVQDIGRTVTALAESGLAVLLVEQNVRLALGLADHVYVMDGGTVIFEGTAEEVEQDEHFDERLMGGTPPVENRRV
jgi:branched-chain amino acid transport system ATP-binding protein